MWAGFWALLSLVVFAFAFSGLPDTVAIHWDATGTADGSAPVWAIPAVALGSIVLGLVLTLQFRIGGRPTMEASALVGMMGGLALAITAMTATANHGIVSWEEAAPLTTWAFLALFGLPILGLLAGIIIGREWFPIKDVPKGDGPVTEVEVGETISWVGRVRVKRVAMITFGLALVLLVIFPDLPLWALLPIVGLGLILTQVEANVTNDGLRIRLGGIPVRKIDIDEISSARSIDLNPVEWGGWGYRVAPGKTAIVLRSGEALVVTLKSGRQFAVTVDDSKTGAGLVNGLVELEAGS